MRKPRVLQDHAKYHVTARTNRKEMILDSIGTKALFLDVIAKAKQRYSFRVENFTIMGNHFHLIIPPGRGVNLSRIMQWILSVFAQTYNRLHNLTGHAWGERFFSRILKNIREYLEVFDYIDANPVKAGLVRFSSSWIFGGLNFRRRGIKKIVDPLPWYLSIQRPQHQQLMIGYQAKP